jgi:hypothetical protein
MKELLEWRVKGVEYVEGYQLHLTFADGKQKTVNLASYLDKPILTPLRDIDYFKTVHIEGSSIAWSNGADFAPEFLYDLNEVSDGKKASSDR